MCGLIAAVDYSHQKFTHNCKEMFFNMLLINSLRGAHSTGVLGVRKDTFKAEWMKAVGDPWNLWQYKEFDTFSDRIVSTYTAIMGHGRYATRGEQIAKNAHPFHRSDVHLIHNGTITNFEMLKKEYANPDQFQVDSDLCANMISTEGIKSTMRQLIGGFAFIWYDAKEQALRAIRNTDRPLYMLNNTTMQRWFLASDEHLLSYIQKKFHVMGEISSMPDGMLHTFRFGQMQVETERIPFHSYGYNMGYSQGNWQRDRAAESAWDLETDGHIYNPMAAACGVAFDTPPDRPAPVSILPRLSLPIVPVEYKAPTGKSALYYKEGKTVWKVKEQIVFVPNGAAPSTNRKTGQITTVIKGIALKSGNIEVTGVYPASWLDIADKGTLEGKIKHITVLDTTDGEFKCRILVENIKPWDIPVDTNDDKETAAAIEGQATEIVDERVFLPLGDETNIAKHRFLLLSKGRCFKCDKILDLKKSQGMLVVNEKVYCEQCVLNKEYPTNG